MCSSDLAGRSTIGAITDGDASTFYSLGVGGTLSVDVSPRALTGASVVEVTYGSPNDDYPESAELWLGGSISGGTFDDTGATLAARLFNDGTFTGASDIATTLGSDGASFSIDIDPNEGFSLITLRDASIEDFGDSYADSGIVSDGFDVGEFTVAAVPLPASGSFLLAALLGAAMLRRRATA